MRADYDGGDGGRTDTSLSRRLLIALLTPVLLLLFAGGLLAFQIARMSEDAAWLDHSQLVIATAFEAQTQVVDQETALRGFLLAGEDRFLEPYRAARPLDALERLRALTSDNPPQARAAAEVARAYEDWHAVAEEIIAPDADLTYHRSTPAMDLRKARMDVFRKRIGDFIARESTIRAARTEASDASATTTRYGLLSVFIGLAGTLALLSRSQLGAIAKTYGAALEGERATRSAVEDQDWIGAGVIELTEAVQGELDVDEVATRALRVVATRVDAVVAAAFVPSASGWTLRSGVGFEPTSELVIARGDGLVGRAALAGAPQWLDDMPHDYLRVRSGLGEMQSVHVVAVPAIAEGRACAVLELGFVRPVSPRVREFVRRMAEPLGATLRAAEYRSRLRMLLDQEQRQSEELQAQQEELRVANEELEQQGSALRAAHVQLEERQQELEELNAGLEAQTLELRRAEREISAKADELARSSQFKSEFLANMSHELRTPLNSTLILAKLLADNEPGTLTPEQIRFAETIHTAGNDLLALINDILDISKIEAGRMELRPSKTTVRALFDPLIREFAPLAEHKGLEFVHDVADDAPLVTDVQRVQQIVKNLVSNAIKFTEVGRVSIESAIVGDRLQITVSDTGIGIRPDQTETIFEAFRQADGTTSRKFGGTGLGLAISRDFARLLGGDVTTQSRPGGSTFLLDIPTVIAGDGAAVSVALSRDTSSAIALARGSSTRRAVAARPSARAASDALLIIEDDAAFASILADLARDLGYGSAIAGTAALGMQLAETLRPRAILLDVRLPDQSGLAVLDALKRQPSTRHIPVHVISATDHAEQALAMGAVGYITKPVTRDDLVVAVRRLESAAEARHRRLLIVEDDTRERESVVRLLEGPDLDIVAVGTAADAIAALRESTFDCMVTDLGLPDASGIELLRRLAADESLAFPPVIVYTGRDLSDAEEEQLRALAPAIIVKGARSAERLLDEVTLFLHRVESEQPPERQRMLRRARDHEGALAGRTVLVVEDDVRNVFAITSALEPKGMKIVIARNGREALERLEQQRVDLVLMDIMMPEMDGLEATRRIRAKRIHAKLPIIALTAKAMPDDRERCLAAGANDYITKPLQVDRLLSLIRVWMRPGATA